MTRLDELEALLAKATASVDAIRDRNPLWLLTNDGLAARDAVWNNADALIAIARAARTVILAKEQGHTAIEMVASQQLRADLDRLNKETDR